MKLHGDEMTPCRRDEDWFEVCGLLKVLEGCLANLEGKRKKNSRIRTTLIRTKKRGLQI